LRPYLQYTNKPLTCSAIARFGIRMLGLAICSLCNGHMMTRLDDVVDDVVDDGDDDDDEVNMDDT
jgi:hypothetical protein